MQFERRRKKKLIVAFHFLSGSSAGWTCAQCRRQGLEASRRCGWLAEDKRGPKRLVWAKGRVATEECPTSLIRPRSVEWLERFYAWKVCGGELLESPAKDADAMLALEKEWREMNHGNESNR